MISRTLTLPAVLCLTVFAVAGCRKISAITYKVMGPDPIPAAYVPEQEPMLVLVENYRNPSESYLDAERFTPHLIQNLTDNKVAPIVDPVELYALRDRKPGQLQKMSIAAIGREVGAKQVLYVDLVTCDVDLGAGSDTFKGSIAVRVKIIDAQSGEILWPTHATDGYPVSFETPVTRAAEGVTRDTVLDMTYRGAADQVAKLFYTWKPVS